MKKTLFLSAILATALCSSAFGGSAVEYTTDDNNVTYSGAIIEYTGNGTNQTIGTQGVTFTVNKSGTTYTCKGASQDPQLGGTETTYLWKYLTNSDGVYYGQTFKLSGSTGSQVGVNTAGMGKIYLGGLITTITSTAEGAVNGSYVFNANSGDLFLEGNAEAGVNMSIGANTKVQVTTNNTIETRTSGTWNIAQGKTLTLEGGRAFVLANTTVTVTGGGTLAFNISNTQKLQMDAGTKYEVSGTGTTMDLSSGLTTLTMGNNAQFAVTGGATLKIGSNITTLTKGTGNTIDVTNGGTLELAQTGDNWGFITSSDSNGTLKLTASEVQYHSQTHWDDFTGHVVISGGTLQVGNYATKFQNAASLTIADNGIIRGWSKTFTRDLILNNGGLGDAGANETFSGTITLQGDNSYASVNSDKTVTLKGDITGTNLTKKDAGTLTIEGEAKSFGSLKAQAGVTNINAALTLSGSLESGAATLNVNKNVQAGKFTSTGNGGHINIANGATLTVSDSSSAQGLWLDPNSVVSVAKGGSISIADGTLTITAAGTTNAEITRHNNNSTSKLGVFQGSNYQASFLKNVKVTGGNVTYTGDDKLMLGSMNGGSITTTADIEFAAADSTISSLTLSGNSITLGTEHTNALTITSTLTVTGTGSTVNANLVMADNSKMDFSSGSHLTMGCGVSIGNKVTIVIDEDIIAGIVSRGETVTIIDSVEQITSLGSNWKFVNAQGDSLAYANLRLEDDGHGNIVVAPEPATATLSLLALAGLCARRRRH